MDPEILQAIFDATFTPVPQASNRSGPSVFFAEMLQNAQVSEQQRNNEKLMRALAMLIQASQQGLQEGNEGRSQAPQSTSTQGETEGRLGLDAILTAQFLETIMGNRNIGEVSIGDVSMKSPAPVAKTTGSGIAKTPAKRPIT